MKKIVFKIFIFLSILIALLFLVNTLFTNKQIYWYKSQEYQKEFGHSNKIDVAFFGSSHTLCSYDPRIIETELNYSAFNFGYANQRLLSAIPLIEQAIDKYNISLGIIDIFKASLERPPYEEKVSAFQLKTFDYLPLSISKIKQMEKIFGMEDALFKVPLLREHALWDEKIFQKKFELGSSQDYYKGFYTKTSFDNETWKKITERSTINRFPKTLDGLQISEFESTIIKKLIKYFQDNNVPLIFINAPIFKGYESDEFYTYNKLLKEYLTSLGAIYINLNEHYNEIGLTKKDFRDLSHLNSSGAIKVTKFLADIIKEDLLISKNDKISYSKNRYYHIENHFEKGLFYFKVKDKLKEKINIESAGLYKINSKYLELVIESNKNLNNIKVDISYKIGANTKKHSIRELPVKLNKNNKYKTTTKLKEVVHFKGKNYYLVRIHIPKGGIYDFSVFIKPLKKEKVRIIKKDYLKL